MLPEHVQPTLHEDYLLRPFHIVLHKVLDECYHPSPHQLLHMGSTLVHLNENQQYKDYNQRAPRLNVRVLSRSLA